MSMIKLNFESILCAYREPQEIIYKSLYGLDFSNFYRYWYVKVHKSFGMLYSERVYKYTKRWL